MAAVDFDINSPEEMCETARVVTDETVASDIFQSALSESVAEIIVQNIYEELETTDNFEKLPSKEEMSNQIANAVCLLMPELVKRVLEKTLGLR